MCVSYSILDFWEFRKFFRYLSSFLLKELYWGSESMKFWMIISCKSAIWSIYPGWSWKISLFLPLDWEKMSGLKRLRHGMKYLRGMILDFYPITAYFACSCSTKETFRINFICRYRAVLTMHEQVNLNIQNKFLHLWWNIYLHSQGNAANADLGGDLPVLATTQNN